MSTRLSDFLQQGTTEPAESQESMRLGDFVSVPREKDAPISEGTLEIPDSQRIEWQDLGPIGAMEQWRRQDKTEMIPFNPEGAIKSTKLLLAVNRLRDPLTKDEQRSKDEALVGNYLERLEEERIRGFTIGGRIIQGVSQLPAFMLEFLATGGLAAGGRYAVKRGISGVTRQIARSGVLKAATRTTGAVAGATMRTAGMPHRIVKGFSDRQVEAGLELTDRGIAIADEAREKPHISVMKAYGDVFIENFSEVVGPALRSGISHLIPVQFKSVLERAFRRLRPRQSVRNLWTKAGYNGFLEELGEERVGDLLRAITGVEDFGAENPERAFDRIVASIPNGEELLVEAAVLSVPGALRMSASQVVDLVQRRKREDAVEEPVLNDLDDEQVDEIVDRPAEPPAPPEAPEEAVETLREAEQSLAEPLVSEELISQLEAAGVDTDAFRAGLEAYEEAVASGKKPSEALEQALASQNIELPERTMRQIRAIVEPDPAPVEQVVTWDAIPSESLNLPITAASPEARRAFSDEAIGLIRGTEGRDLLAEQLGIRQAKVDPSTRLYEGDVHPNAVTILSGDTPIEKVRQYARAIQYIFSQDQVPFFKIDDRGKTQGFVLTFHEPLTPDREEGFFEALKKSLTDAARYTKLSDTEIAVVNDGDFPEFSQSLSELAENNGSIASIQSFRARSEAGPVQDWGADPDAQALRDQAVAEGPPAIQDWLDSRRQGLKSILSAWSDPERTLRGELEPPVDFEYVPMEGLSPAQRAVETRLAGILSRPDAESKYAFMDRTFDGKLLDVDLARYLSPEYNRDNSSRSLHTPSTQRPSNAWIEKRYRQLLALPARNPVYLLSGGGASGKTTAVQGLIRDPVNDSDIVFDGVNGNFDKAVDRIERALESGRSVLIAHVYRPATQAAESMAVRFRQMGRWVPAEVLANDHVRSQETFLAIHERYKDDPRVGFKVFDNSGPEPAEMSIDKLRSVRYTKRGESIEQSVGRLLPKIHEVTGNVEEEIEKKRSDAVEAQEAGEVGLEGGPGRIERSPAFRPLGDLVRPRQLKRAIRQATGQIRPREPLVSEFVALRNSLRAQSRAALLARRMTLKEVKSSQDAVVRLIEGSPMESQDKAKFIRSVKNIQTQEQLAGAIPEIESRIDDLIERSAKRRTVEAIRRELKKIRPRRVTGRLVGKFTPTIQEALTKMQRAIRLPQAQAEARLADSLLKNDSGNTVIPEPVTAFENMALNVSALRDELEVGELREVLRVVRALKLSGKEARGLSQFRERADLDEMRRIARSMIDSRPKDRILTTADEDADDTRFGWYNRATAHIIGWNNIMNRLSRKDKSTATNESVLNRIADVSDAETAEKRGLRLNLRKFRRAWTRSFGDMSDWRRTAVWAGQTERKSLGRFSNVRGEQVEILMSKAEARKRWMEFQDPSLHETIFGEEGMAWTEEMRRAVERFLSPQDIQFARDQMAFYRQYYDGFNQIYGEINGVNLPRNRFYSPIRRVFMEREAMENELLGEITHRRSITPSAAKARIRNIRHLQQLNDFEIMERHIQQVEHYKAWARKIRVLNGIFNDASVREAVQANFGRGLLRAIDRAIQDFTRGGIDRSSDSAVLNTLKNNYTVAVLSGKFAIAVKQLMSFPAFADSIPTKEFMKGLADLGKDPVRKIRILATSEVMRSRGLAITPELKEAVNSKEWVSFQLNPHLRNLLLTMTRWGDRGAIYLGGWPVYRYHRFVLGKKHSEAIREFEIALSSSQQSADLSQASLFQRGNSFQRLFSVFLSAPNQYFRKELIATEDMLAGRISKQKWAKTMAIYHFILPMMFQWASDGLEFRIKEQVRAGILGSLNGIFILGDVLENMLSQALGLKVWQSSTIIDSVVRESLSLIRKLKPEDLDAETFFEAMKQAFEVAGLAKGLPAPQAINIIEGVNLMKDAQTPEEWWNGFRRVAGWSQFVIDQGGKDKGPF